MQTLATLFGGILTALRQGLGRHATGASAPQVFEVQNRLSRWIDRFGRLFARYQAGILPSQTGVAPRPSRPGRTNPDRRRYPTQRMWLTRLAQPPSSAAASQLQHWMTHPEFVPFLAAAPQAGRLLRPLCRALGVEASPDVPAALALPAPPRFRPAPPPPPIWRGVIDPPEVRPFAATLARDRAGRAWYQ